MINAINAQTYLVQTQQNKKTILQNDGSIVNFTSEKRTEPPIVLIPALLALAGGIKTALIADHYLLHRIILPKASPTVHIISKEAHDIAFAATIAITFLILFINLYKLFAKVMSRKYKIGID